MTTPKTKTDPFKTWRHNNDSTTGVVDICGKLHGVDLETDVRTERKEHS